MKKLVKAIPLTLVCLLVPVVASATEPVSSAVADVSECLPPSPFDGAAIPLEEVLQAAQVRPSSLSGCFLACYDAAFSQALGCPAGQNYAVYAVGGFSGCCIVGGGQCVSSGCDALATQCRGFATSCSSSCS